MAHPHEFDADFGPYTRCQPPSPFMKSGPICARPSSPQVTITGNTVIVINHTQPSLTPQTSQCNGQAARDATAPHVHYAEPEPPNHAVHTQPHPRQTQAGPGPIRTAKGNQAPQPRRQRSLDTEARSKRHAAFEKMRVFLAKQGIHKKSVVEQIHALADVYQNLLKENRMLGGSLSK